MAMAVLLPFWITFGRGALGSGGWLSLILLFTVAPTLLIALSIISWLIRSRPSVKANQMVTQTEAYLMTAIYASVFLFGLFVVDGGDTPSSVYSVATKFLGQSFNSLSDYLGRAFFIITWILIAYVLVDSIIKKVRRV